MRRRSPSRWSVRPFPWRSNRRGFEPENLTCHIRHVGGVGDPTRTVVDLMRLRHRLGETLAHGALPRYLRRRDARPASLLQLAGELEVRGPVQHALDVALAQ